MHLGILGDDPMIFLLSFVNRVKYSDSYPNNELSLHCYYECHLVMVYFFYSNGIIFYSIQLLIFFASVFRFLCQVLTATLCQLCKQNPKAVLCMCSETF